MLAEQAQNDNEGEDYQRLTWDALRKSINGLINKVNVANIKLIVPEVRPLPWPSHTRRRGDYRPLARVQNNTDKTFLPHSCSARTSSAARVSLSAP